MRVVISNVSSVDLFCYMCVVLSVVSSCTSLVWSLLRFGVYFSDDHSAVILMMTWNRGRVWASSVLLGLQWTCTKVVWLVLVGWEGEWISVCQLWPADSLVSSECCSLQNCVWLSFRASLVSLNKSQITQRGWICDVIQHFVREKGHEPSEFQLGAKQEQCGWCIDEASGKISTWAPLLQPWFVKPTEAKVRLRVWSR